MTIEVYSSGRPAVPRRALLVMILIAAGAIAAAAWFVGARGSDPLGPRLNPDGWSLSFRPPRAFVATRLLFSGLGPAIRFQGDCGDAECELTFWQVPLPEPVGEEELARLILRSIQPWRWTQFLTPGTPPVATSAFVGRHQGVELFDAGEGVVVRAAMLSANVGAIASLKRSAPPIDEDSRGAFDASCRSLRLVHPRSRFVE